MALPKVIGDNPTEETIPKNTWTKLFSSVNTGVITNRNPNDNTLYVTYLKAGEVAIPTDIDFEPKWSVYTPPFKVTDGVTLRDVYGYAKDNDAVVILES